MKQRRAINLIRRNVRARAAALDEGLRALGYEIEQNPPEFVRDTDILLIWNRYGNMDRIAKKFEAAGRPVIVVENSYVNMRGTKKAFAMALHHHNGGGTWPEDDTRAPMLDVELQPWRTDGKLIMLLPQRGIGPPGVAMPKSWPQATDRKLAGLTDRPRYIRRHPGVFKEARPLEEDCLSAWCAVTWGSGAGIKALIQGVPTFYEFKHWIGGLGGHYGTKAIKGLNKADAHKLMGDREAMLRVVASAQFTIEEVATGEPFARLIEWHEKRNTK